MTHTNRGGFREGSARAARRGEDLSSEEDDEFELNDKFSCIPPNVAFNNCLKDHCGEDIDLYGKRTDNDSGIYNSSKATTSIGSYSDQDYESEIEERHGMFDYFPSQQATVKVHKARVGCSLDYDEAHEVEDSDKDSPRYDSSNHSPRYDHSLSKLDDVDFGTEMKTFRTVRSENDDFMTDDDSDSEKFTPHRKLYQRKCAAGRNKSGGNYYTPMTRENKEEYGSLSTLTFDQSKLALRNTTASSLRTTGVDENINFPLTNTCPKSYGSTSSHGVKVETTYSRHHKQKDFTDKGPPFGQGQDQLGKVGNSISTLISNSQSAHISNLPEGRPILMSGPDLGVDNGKKRKKKKKGAKDDLDDKGKKADFDENGNPCLSEHVSNLLPKTYRQMRESPQPADRGATASKTRFRQNQNGCFPSKLDQFENFPLGGQQVKELDDLSTAQTSAETANSHKKPRKKVKKEKIIRAEEVENYVGDKDVSELLKFIEDNGGPAAKKAGKKLNHTTAAPLSTTTDTITNSVKTSEKNAKKGRDKKHKPSVGSKVIEGHCGRERSESVSALSGKEEEEEETVEKGEEGLSLSVQQEEDIELEAVIVENPVQSKASPLLIQNSSVSVNTMGNSYGRTSKEENGLFTSDESVIGACEKLNNDISGENNKDFTKLVTQNNHVVHGIGKVRINSLQENDKVHEEKSVKNNKKKMGSVTVANSVSLQVNNKRADKAKNVTGEEKMVTGSTNNVKHNNNKNSKAKGESASMETSESEGKTKSDIVKTPPSKSLTASDAAVNTKNNMVLSKENYDNYIFTDLDLPAAEPEFTVVGKKKKRPVTGTVHNTPQMIKEPNNINHSIKNGNVHAPLRTVGRVERPRKPMPRSVTPPPRNSLSTSDSIDSERLRDLSPSSFPALSSSSSSINCGRQTFREGRRNSTGDVPCKEIVLKVQDDSSDIESVKSLPVAQGGPHLPISYAKMAASPKPSNTSLAGSNGETEEMYSNSQEANKEWKCANWKGSPTERRHSIGSSPENNVKEIDNVLPTRQKYGGSQEVLVTPGEGEDGSRAHGDEEVVSPVASPSASFMTEDPLEVVLPSVSSPVCSKVIFGDVTMANVSRSYKKTNSLSDHQVSVSSSTTFQNTVLPGNISVVTPASGNGDMGCAPSPAADVVNSVPGECVQALKEPSPECRGQQTTKSHVPPTKHQTGNGRKVHKNKSVIFLDKRLNQVPKNLGITFGFELNIASDMIGDSAEQCSVIVDDRSISSTSSQSTTSVLSHQSSPSDSDVPNMDTNSVITSSHQHSHSETSNELCMSSNLTFDNEKCKQSVVTKLSKDNVSKISHSLSGKNGIVLPKTDNCEIVPSASSETSNTAVHTCQTSNSTIENKISSDSDLSRGNNSRPNSIVVCYGDSINKLTDLASPIPSANDKTECVRQLRFVPEKDVNKTCFNITEAVSYVVREWDKIIQLKDKNPADVVVYSSSE